jgi:hypothetical protein
MAKWSFLATNWTPGTGVADGTASNNPAQSIRGGNATQFIDILEVKVTGLAGASAPTPLLLGRVSTIASAPTTLTASFGHFGALNPFTAQLSAPMSAWTSANPNSTRSTTVSEGQLDCGVNAFGGILRWNAAPTQQFSMYGNTSDLGEIVLSCTTGGTPGLIQSHILVEPM